jgi:hypothetical protein
MKKNKKILVPKRFVCYKIKFNLKINFLKKNKINIFEISIISI